MHKLTGFAVFAAALLASSTAWAAQVGLTSAQARTVAKFESVAVLVDIDDMLDIKAPDGVCTDIQALADWDFRKQIEEHASRLLTTRFSVVPKAYQGAALRPSFSTFGQVSRDALPAADDIDAFIVFSGSVHFLHAAGLPSPGTRGALEVEVSKGYTIHDPEIVYITLGVEIIDAKSKKTIARKGFPQAVYQGLTSGGWGIIKQRFIMVASSAGAKERPEADWICRHWPTEEKLQALRDDFRFVIQGALEEGLPILRLAQGAEQPKKP
jgi:hypothetical protein